MLSTIQIKNIEGCVIAGHMLVIARSDRTMLVDFSLTCRNHKLLYFARLWWVKVILHHPTRILCAMLTGVLVVALKFLYFNRVEIVPKRNPISLQCGLSDNNLLCKGFAKIRLLITYDGHIWSWELNRNSKENLPTREFLYVALILKHQSLTTLPTYRKYITK